MYRIESYERADGIVSFQLIDDSGDEPEIIGRGPYNEMLALRRDLISADEIGE